MRNESKLSTEKKFKSFLLSSANYFFRSSIVTPTYRTRSVPTLVVAFQLEISSVFDIGASLEAFTSQRRRRYLTQRCRCSLTTSGNSLDTSLKLFKTVDPKNDHSKSKNNPKPNIFEFSLNMVGLYIRAAPWILAFEDQTMYFGYPP